MNFNTINMIMHREFLNPYNCRYPQLYEEPFVRFRYLYDCYPFYHNSYLRTDHHLINSPLFWEKRYQVLLGFKSISFNGNKNYSMNMNILMVNSIFTIASLIF